MAQQTLTKAKANIKKIRYLPRMPFYGRENHVRIAELAKAGLRFLGDKEPADNDFIVEEYGLVSVKPIVLEYQSGNKETVWVGKAVTAKGKAELDRLIGDKLPWIGERDDLPAEFKRMYVKSKAQTMRDDAKRQKKEMADLRSRGKAMAKVASIDELKRFRSDAVSVLKYEKGPVMIARKELEIQIIDNELASRKRKSVKKPVKRTRAKKPSMSISGSRR